MPPIPETGGGLSGFLAHCLWQVYRHFPSTGRWDWLLLFFGLGLAIHALFLPYLWKAIADDMQYLRKHEVKKMGRGYHAAFGMIITASMFFLAWFFHTEAGRTLLDGRALFGSLPASERSIGMWWASFLLCVGVMVLFIGPYAAIEKRNKALAPARSLAYTDRSLLSLFGGGGVFVYLDEKGKEYTTQGWDLISVELAVLLLTHMCYWYWSVASHVLFLMFLTAGLLTDACRVVFVAIQHKRTFG